MPEFAISAKGDIKIGVGRLRVFGGGWGVGGLGEEGLEYGGGGGKGGQIPSRHMTS